MWSGLRMRKVWMTLLDIFKIFGQAMEHLKTLRENLRKTWELREIRILCYWKLCLKVKFFYTLFLGHSLAIFPWPFKVSIICGHWFISSQFITHLSRVHLITLHWAILFLHIRRISFRMLPVRLQANKPPSWIWHPILTTALSCAR